MPSLLELIAQRSATQQRHVVEGKKGEVIDVPEGSGLLITGCSGCTINAPGRSSNVILEQCDGTSLVAGYIVASLEVIRCKDVKVSVKRCRTITVDMSTNVTLSCECKPSSDGSGTQQGGGGEGDDYRPSPAQESKVRETEAADEASAVRLFTSSSDRVSIIFEGISRRAVTYRVPKDGGHKKGDDSRSVSRITVHRTGGVGGMGRGGGGGTCKTLPCDRFGIPLEETKAAQAGVPWTWEHGRGARQGQGSTAGEHDLPPLTEEED